MVVERRLKVVIPEDHRIVVTHERLVMARVLRPGEADDGSFDLDFWARVGPEGRFAAAWEMVGEAERMKGRDGEPPRLDKTAVRVIRR